MPKLIKRDKISLLMKRDCANKFELIKKKPKVLLFIVLLYVVFFLLPPKAYSKDDKDLYHRAVRIARKGQLDFAFSYFDTLLRTQPESKFTEPALFFIGEYHFLSGNVSASQDAFRQFVNNYPESKSKLFALVYLWKIAEKTGEKTLAEDLKKEIISFKQLSLLFRDFEEFKYLSVLSKNYKAVYFIDRIEIFIDGDLFAKIPF